MSPLIFGTSLWEEKISWQSGKQHLSFLVMYSKRQNANFFFVTMHFAIWKKDRKLVVTGVLVDFGLYFFFPLTSPYFFPRLCGLHALKKKSSATSFTFKTKTPQLFVSSWHGWLGYWTVRLPIPLPFRKSLKDQNKLLLFQWLAVTCN